MERKEKPISDVLSDGVLLRQVRQSKGISLTKMAKNIHYAKGYLSDVENGKERVTISVRKAYENYFRNRD